MSGPAQELPAPDTVAEDVTSQLPAETPAAESQAAILPSVVEAGESDVRRSPQPDTSLSANPAPDAVPEAVAKEASESAGASHVSPRRLPSWNVDPPSPDSVPGVTPRGSPFLHLTPAQPSPCQVPKWGPSSRPVFSSVSRILQPREPEALHQPPTPTRRTTLRLSVLRSSRSRLATWYVTRLAPLLSSPSVVLTPLL